MKHVWTLWVAALVWVGCGRDPQGGGSAARPVARWHFVGGQALRAAKDTPKLSEVLQLPESSGVGGRLGTNIARIVIARADLPPGPASEGALHPLIEAALENESAGEVGDGFWWVGVRGPDRSGALGPAVAALAGPRPAGAAARTVMLATNGWWFAASTADAVRRAMATVSQGQAGILQGEFDLPRIFQADPEFWPRMEIHVGSSNTTVRTRATLDFARAPLGDLGPWQIPDDYIRDPIIRFSALRGAGPLVDRVGWLKLLAGGAGPAQVISWAQPEVTFRNWFAFPVDDGPARIRKVAADLLPYFGTTNAPGRYIGRMLVNSNSSAVAVFDMQACRPTLGEVKQGDQSFLVASFVPGIRSTNRIPAELLGQLQRDDLAFYEWEITGEAARNWNVLAQFNLLAQRRVPNPVGARAFKWLMAAAGRLGNTVTEVRRESPTRYVVSRKSDAGLNGLELLLLTRWIDDGFSVVRPPDVALPPVPVPKP